MGREGASLPRFHSRDTLFPISTDSHGGRHGRGEHRCPVRYDRRGPHSPHAFYFTTVYYQDALGLAAFPSRALNSLAIATLSIGAALAVGIPVSYILARVDIKGKGAVSFMFLALRTVSPFAVVLPLYIFFSRVGLWDTYQGVALAELLFVLAIVVWMVKGFFADIPRQVYDAASVFTTSEGQIFRRVALPLVAGGVAVTAIFGIVLIWNEFLISTIFTGPHTKSVAVGVWTGGEGKQYAGVHRPRSSRHPRLPPCPRGYARDKEASSEGLQPRHGTVSASSFFASVRLGAVGLPVNLVRRGRIIFWSFCLMPFSLRPAIARGLLLPLQPRTLSRLQARRTSPNSP